MRTCQSSHAPGRGIGSPGEPAVFHSEALSVSLGAIPPGSRDDCSPCPAHSMTLRSEFMSQYAHLRYWFLVTFHWATYNTIIIRFPSPQNTFKPPCPHKKSTFLVTFYQPRMKIGSNLTFWVSRIGGGDHPL